MGLCKETNEKKKNYSVKSCDTLAVVKCFRHCYTLLKIFP